MKTRSPNTAIRTVANDKTFKYTVKRIFFISTARLRFGSILSFKGNKHQTSKFFGQKTLWPVYYFKACNLTINELLHRYFSRILTKISKDIIQNTDSQNTYIYITPLTGCLWILKIDDLGLRLTKWYTGHENRVYKK